MSASVSATVVCAVLVVAVAVSVLIPHPVSMNRHGSSVSSGVPRRVATWIGVRLTARHHPGDQDLAVHQALAGLARSLRAGHSLPIAVGQLAAEHGHLWPDLTSALRRHERGEALHDAIAAGTAPPNSAARLLARSLVLATRPSLDAQGRLRAIDLAAALALDRSAVRTERRTQSAQARLSALVLTWVPLVVCGLAAATDEAVRAVLMGTFLGAVCLVAGTTLLVSGHLWIRRLVDGGDP